MNRKHKMLNQLFEVKSRQWLRNRSLTARELRRVDALETEIRTLCYKEAKERFDAFAPLFDKHEIKVIR